MSVLPTFIFHFSCLPHWLHQLSPLQWRLSQHLGEKNPKTPKDTLKSISVGSVSSFRAMLLCHSSPGLSQVPVTLPAPQCNDSTFPGAHSILLRHRCALLDLGQSCFPLEDPPGLPVTSFAPRLSTPKVKGSGSLSPTLGCSLLLGQVFAKVG